MVSKRTSDLPPEIIEAIMLTSSVKPLLRFKSVSKSWNALISDPLFVKNHHQTSKSSNPQNLFLYNFVSPNKLSFVKLENGKLQTFEEKPKGLPVGLNHVVCFGEGVLLVTNSSFSRYVLFNPSTRAHTELVMPNQFDDIIRHFTCGLCRDPTTGDFKVVVVRHNHYAVYSCKNKSWTKRESPTTITRAINWRSGVCVNGAIYWVRRTTINGSTRTIIYFDPRDDTLKILPKPKDVDGDKMIYLVDLRSSLCLYCSGEDKTTVQIWTKEKGIDNNSWKEMMTIRIVSIPIYYFEPQCFLGNKLLIRNEDSAELVVYNPSEKTFERVEDIKVHGLGLIPYVDTLFSPVITNTRPTRKRKGLY